MATYHEQKKMHQSVNGLLFIDDPEVKFLNQSIERKKEHVAMLELEISTMKRLQSEMESLYLREISPLESQLKALREQLKTGKHPGKGEKDSPKNESKKEEEPEKRQEQAKKKSIKKNDTPFDEKKARVIFRSLAKKFHPDTIRDEELKTQYEATMARINTAYQHRDMETLEKMMQENLPQEERHYATKEEEISLLRSELNVLKKKVKRLEQRLVEIDQLPIMRFRIQMNLAKKEGRNLIEELKQQLRFEIEEIEYIL